MSTLVYFRSINLFWNVFICVPSDNVSRRELEMQVIFAIKENFSPMQKSCYINAQTQREMVSYFSCALLLLHFQRRWHSCLETMNPTLLILFFLFISCSEKWRPNLDNIKESSLLQFHSNKPVKSLPFLNILANVSFKKICNLKQPYSKKIGKDRCNRKHESINAI